MRSLLVRFRGRHGEGRKTGLQQRSRTREKRRARRTKVTQHKITSKGEKYDKNVKGENQRREEKNRKTEVMWDNE